LYSTHVCTVLLYFQSRVRQSIFSPPTSAAATNSMRSHHRRAGTSQLIAVVPVHVALSHLTHVSLSPLCLRSRRMELVVTPAVMIWTAYISVNQQPSHQGCRAPSWRQLPLRWHNHRSFDEVLSALLLQEKNVVVACLVQVNAA
jgi:hypothetical protein